MENVAQKLLMFFIQQYNFTNETLCQRERKYTL